MEVCMRIDFTNTNRDDADVAVWVDAGDDAGACRRLVRSFRDSVDETAREFMKHGCEPELSVLARCVPEKGPCPQPGFLHRHSDRRLVWQGERDRHAPQDEDRTRSL
jgi:hypothetical protein